MARYLEKRDPDFDERMAEVLCIYQEVNLQSEAGSAPSVITPVGR